MAEWKASMSRSEFLAWVQFYELQPFDDFHRFHRPAALVAQSLGGGSTEEKLAWLQPKPVAFEAEDAHRTEADMNTLRAFGFRK